MQTQSGVSICIPAYNGEKYLQEALDSCLQQTYTGIEILVVEDSSTDATLEIANAYAQQHNQIRVVRNTAKAGMVANWMKCIELAAHPWIKFLFQDDILEPDAVAKLMRLCAATGCLAAFCRRDFIFEKGVAEETQRYFSTLIKPEALFPEGKLQPEQVALQVARHGFDNIFGEPSVLLFHRSLLLQTAGFENNLRQLMDFDFMLRLGLLNRLAFTPERLVGFRVHGHSQTAANRTGAETEAVKKMIRSGHGDELWMLEKFLTGKEYEAIRTFWPEEDLRASINYLYWNAQKKWGKAATDAALVDLKALLPSLPSQPYNLLRYLWTKQAVKKYRKLRRNL